MKKAWERRWVVVILGAILAAQTYFVQEALAALLLALAGFAAMALLAGGVYALHRVGLRVLASLEAGAKLLSPLMRPLLMKSRRVLAPRQ
jgi:hypothetical protein